MLLNKLNVVCWEKSEGAVRREPLPPALVNLINIRYHIARIKSDFCFITYKKTQ